MPNLFTPRDARTLVGRDNALILEIGCNDGQDTVQFLEAFSSAVIPIRGGNRCFTSCTLECFEPDPRAIAKWKHRINANQNWPMYASLFQAALSDSLGKKTFHQSSGTPPGPEWVGSGEWDMSGSLLPVDKHSEYVPWLKFESQIEVSCVTLDYWADLWLKPGELIDFAWIDVQGAEAMVLRGGQKTLKRVDFVYAECHPLPYYHGQATLDELDLLLADFDRIAEYAQHNYLWRKKGRQT